MLQQLLSERRIRISAHCFEVIRMFAQLRRAVGGRASTFLDPEQDTKHAFDALSYPVARPLPKHMLAIATLHSPTT